MKLSHDYAVSIAIAQADELEEIKSEQRYVIMGGSNCEVFELSTGTGSNKLKCLFAVAKEEVFTSPKVIGMADMEAYLRVMQDGMSLVLHEKHVLVPISWMIKEKPQFADDLRKLSEIARSENGKLSDGTSE